MSGIMRVRLVVMVVFGAVWFGFVIVNGELGCRDAGAKNPGGVYVVTRHGQGAKSTLQLVKRETGVEQRAQHHVP